MNDILIYGGIGINIIGALFLMAYSMKYGYKFYKSRQQPIRMKALQPGWSLKRNIGFGLMIFGSLITIAGCII